MQYRSSTTIPRIAITTGEPAGIGPDVVLQIAAQSSFSAELVVVADRNLLQQRAAQLGLKIQLREFGFNQQPVAQCPGQLLVQHVSLADPVIPGKLNKNNARYVIETLKWSAENCLSKKFTALVTGPVHKGIINDADIPFSGHTKFFAELTHTPEVVMMLAVEKFRVALVTTHLPLTKVSENITAEKLTNVIKILHYDLQTKFAIQQPKIFVSGLNPHAGENGHLGTEEIAVIAPVLKILNTQGFNLIGPLPADTIFLPKILQQADAILMMYHDQGLPVIKFYGFDKAVNISLGLPFIRTSVDHGTALELAASGNANPASMKAALSMALQLHQHELTKR